MYAYVIDGIVSNIVNADAEWVSEQHDAENYFSYTQEDPAFIGGPYINGSFYEPQPYLSWTLNLTSGQWVPPVPKPTSNMQQPDEPDFDVIEKYWSWDEDNTRWFEDPNWVYVVESKHFIYSPQEQ
jgi:hypothetical protein